MACDGANCFHFSLHNSPFILAAQRPAAGFPNCLGGVDRLFAQQRELITVRVDELGQPCFRPA
jgi:hypothetical protein